MPTTHSYDSLAEKLRANPSPTTLAEVAKDFVTVELPLPPSKDAKSTVQYLIDGKLPSKDDEDGYEFSVAIALGDMFAALMDASGGKVDVPNMRELRQLRDRYVASAPIGGRRRRGFKFDRCVKTVRKTVKARKGSNNESAAIAICVTSVLHPKGRTLKRYRKGRLLTQKKR